jgi:Domain of unknown function (DUF1992)
VTERRPPRIRFETWIDRQIREGIERGDFENLPGAGKPIPGLGETHDEFWWVKQKLQREEMALLPPTLALRKEAEDARRTAAQAGSEVQARRVMDEINEKIRKAMSTPLAGPPLNLAPFDVEGVIEQWRTDHPPPDRADEEAADPIPPPRCSWWRRRLAGAMGGARRRPGPGAARETGA